MRKLWNRDKEQTEKMKLYPEQIEGEGILINTYDELVKEIAELSFLNPDVLLFFRGQEIDHKNKADKTSIYPSIYRGTLSKDDLRYKRDILDAASRLLIKELEETNFIGYKEIKSKKYVQWGILQHYEVCATPLLDITHSIRVACSFAQLGSVSEHVYIYVIGMPYITNRISINSEHDIVNIRLLSISPPQALRPYFQDGYLAGTEYIFDEYESKEELDFNRRLIAKYRIPNNDEFWGIENKGISKDHLYPQNDKMEVICNNIMSKIVNSVSEKTIGEFVRKWAKLENEFNTRYGSLSIMRNLKTAVDDDSIDENLFKDIDLLRRYRNELVHNISNINNVDISNNLQLLDDVRQRMKIKNVT